MILLFITREQILNPVPLQGVSEPKRKRREREERRDADIDTPYGKLRALATPYQDNTSMIVSLIL